MRYEQLRDDLNRALKAREGERADFLRFILAELHNKEIEKRTKSGEGALSEDDVTQVLRREIKKRKEALLMFEQGGRNDLVEREKRDLAFLYEYVPPEMPEEEIAKIVERLVQGGIREFGALMRETMKQTGSRADGRAVAEIVKKKLGV